MISYKHTYFHTGMEVAGMEVANLDVHLYLISKRSVVAGSLSVQGRS